MVVLSGSGRSRLAALSMAVLSSSSSGSSSSGSSGSSSRRSGSGSRSRRRSRSRAAEGAEGSRSNSSSTSSRSSSSRQTSRGGETRFTCEQQHCATNHGRGLRRRSSIVESYRSLLIASYVIEVLTHWLRQCRLHCLTVAIARQRLVGAE